MAGRLNTDWFVVYVQTPEESPLVIDAEAQRHLHTTIEMARELGAQVVKLESSDPITAVLDFATSNRVGNIIIGRSNQPWWRKLLRRDFMTRLIDGAAGFDVNIVSLEEAEGEE